MSSQKFVPALALGLLLSASGAHALPFQITAQLTGDPRAANPDGIVVDITINGDTESNVANWLVDLAAPAHPGMKLHELYFNMAGGVGDYSFGSFSPTAWTAQPNDKVKGAGAGGAIFLFEVVDPPGMPSGGVTDASSLGFDMIKSTGNFAVADFLGAPMTTTSAGFTSQIGAHLQNLSLIGTPLPTSDSGFATGNFRATSVPPPTQSVPEPAPVFLLTAGLLGLALARRRGRRA